MHSYSVLLKTDQYTSKLGYNLWIVNGHVNKQLPIS